MEISKENTQTQELLFSKSLNDKIRPLLERRKPISLGSVEFQSPLLLAPMSMICKSPFRRLMEDLGAGGTVSELISCHGINYKNEKTLDMLKIHPKEKSVGIQLFGEDAQKMALAAQVACDQEVMPKFIDINMGCPVRKVVSKGGGSALLKDPTKLADFFKAIKNAIPVPLTIKIRTGWDQDNRNADEVLHIAKEEGIEFVAVHGRTRTQQYKGHADWEYLETLANNNILPLIGNGDLNTAQQVQTRLQQTNCQALMLGRGPLRNPFLFLESELQTTEDLPYFTARDYLEVILVLVDYIRESQQEIAPRHLLVQMRKHIIWMAAGFKGAGLFRDLLFKTPEIDETLKLTRDFFFAQADSGQSIDFSESFMTSGHG